MKFLKKKALGLFFLLLSCSVPTACYADGNLSAADQDTLEKGWQAYNIGHYKETVALLQPLAVNGNATAQVLIGRCYESGLGVEQNLETAAKWYSIAAEQGDPQGILCLAYCYENGVGVNRDEGKTLELMKNAAEKGVPEAQFNLALYASKGRYGVPKNYEESFTWAKRAADQGYAQAERYVGACYEYGVGVEMNVAEAAKWYAKAKAKGLEKEGNVFKTVHDSPM
ncbi:MAG: sel1 repeat family protein [Desulfovibrio sp.]|nr:sel1 repeat family protein [Desulfovibrio sp.]